MSVEPAAFLSYAHADDYDGQVTRFVDRLRAEIRSYLGREFPIFRDRDHIYWGEAWRGRVDGSLDSVTFLIAILSPSFFQSAECQRELEKFRERERNLGRNDLILCVIWIEPDEFSDEKHQLAAFLKERRFEKWEDLRHQDPYKDAAKERIAALAKQVKLAVKRPSSARPNPTPPAPSLPAPVGPSPAPIKTTLSPGAPPPQLPTPGEVRVHPADGLAYVWIPPGEFDMGCSPGDKNAPENEKPAHRVRITRGFWIGQTPVTQAAYEKVIGRGNNPSQFEGAYLPVDSVTWHEAEAYCRAVNGRLPTEAEWEYAARAGNAEVPDGDFDKIAFTWYQRRSIGKTWAVGEAGPNGWGLYDMLGNVWEWVVDWFDEDYYKSRPATDIDPTGPEHGVVRVLRGGSSFFCPWDPRVYHRHRGEPDNRSEFVGFRCTREAFP